MFESSNVDQPSNIVGEGTASRWTKSYAGPDRRAAPQLWFAPALDEIDFGILILSPAADVHCANRAAIAESGAEHPLLIVAGKLVARDLRESAKLWAALQEASERGLRRMLTLGHGQYRLTAAVVPLASMPGATGANVMLMLGRRSFAATLGIEAFARSHGLTPAETRVMTALCRGDSPQQIAGDAGVEISTIRTQILSIREKTGARSLRTLITQVATLPPFMGILGNGAGLSLVERPPGDSIGRRTQPAVAEAA